MRILPFSALRGYVKAGPFLPWTFCCRREIEAVRGRAWGLWFEMKPFAILDHTADIGLTIHGDTLNSLFEHAGEGFFYLITDTGKIEPRVERQIQLAGEALERLLVDWLDELLYLFEVDHLLCKEFRVESVGPQGLKATVKGEHLREGVHVIKTVIKAVTYHQIQVKETQRGWRAQIIFDL